MMNMVEGMHLVMKVGMFKLAEFDYPGKEDVGAIDKASAVIQRQCD